MAYSDLQVDYIMDPDLPEYGPEYDQIGRGAPVFRLIGNVGERQKITVVKFFGTDDEAYAWLEDIDTIRGADARVWLMDDPDLGEGLAIQLFLHGARGRARQTRSSRRGDGWVVSLNLDVTRLSTARRR